MVVSNRYYELTEMQTRKESHLGLLDSGPYLIETEIILPTAVTDGYDQNNDGILDEYVETIFQVVLRINITDNR